MTKRKCLLIGWVGLCCLAACGAVSYAQEDDPAINDKPLSQGIKQLRGDNRGFQMRAARALAEAPTNARPAIIEQVIPVLKSPRENDKFVAAQVLGIYGAMARVAVPDLLPMLKGTQYERNRAAAAKALGQILKDAQPSEEIDKVTEALTASFMDLYEDVRREAATACGMIGPAGKACIPHLKPLLEEPPGAGPNANSVAAAWTCERMGPLAREHVDLLITLIHRNENLSTPAYVLALRAIGPVQDNIIPNIIDMIESAGRGGDCGVFKAAAFATLASFGEKSAAVVPHIRRTLQSQMYGNDGTVISTAMMKALPAFGAASKEAAPEILAQIRYAEEHLAAYPECVALREEAKKAYKAVTGQEPPAAKKK